MSKAGKASLTFLAAMLIAIGAGAVLSVAEKALTRKQSATEAIYYSILNRAYMCGIRDGQIAIMSRMPEFFGSEGAILKNDDAACRRFNKPGTVIYQAADGSWQTIENIENK